MIKSKAMEKRFTTIVQYNDKKLGPILRQKTKDVVKVDAEVKRLFEDLTKLAKENSKDGITLVGLSAPQVGWGIAAFVFYDLNTKKYIEVVNPKVLYSSKETNVEWEGCASIGTGATSLFGPVKRSRACQIQFTNIDGKDEVISVSNYQSHILQHEVDHLNGILFLDRVNDPKMIFTARELDDYAKRNNGKYPEI
jgi:peptide deformylase